MALTIHELDPPIILTPAQCRSLAEAVNEGADCQVIYSYDDKGWVIVGQHNPATAHPDDAEGDGVWLDQQGVEQHGG